MTPEEFNLIITSCQNSSVGKLLPNALYVHQSTLVSLDSVLQNYEQQGRVTEQIIQATIVKFSTDKPKISYLFYPDFDSHPHPTLQLSIVVDMETLQFSYWNYQNTENPPILHRKETFINPDYPNYENFAYLTYCEEQLGLLDNPRFIGNQQDWQKRLIRCKIAFSGHSLICPFDGTSNPIIAIERHRAALVRKNLSRPVRLALEAGLLTPEITTFFDYGCGYGGDIQRLAEQGYESSGWDPYYRNDTPKIEADVVNLGYIINVIENLQERREALINAWGLTKQVLIVAAQVLIDDSSRGIMAYGDGVITSRNTFQKYYEQEELKTYIDQVLNVDSIPAGLGIYFVFRDENQAQTFRISRFHSRAITPKIQVQLKRFEDYENLLKPLMEFFTERGRLPAKFELENGENLQTEFGTFRQAFKVILQVTNIQDWDIITEKRRQDLLLYLALSKFSNRPRSSRKLLPEIKEDIKALFGSYEKACIMADIMLYSVGDLEKITNLCHSSLVGKKSKNHLLVHLSALDSLAPLLRLYEGCASRIVGCLDDANIIRFSCNQPKITYLYYPDFDSNPHPLLHSSMEINLGDLRVKYREFFTEDNPPILHEKDQLVNTDYPLYQEFHELTKREKKLGLLKNFKNISRLQGWLQCLKEHSANLSEK